MRRIIKQVSVFILFAFFKTGFAQNIENTTNKTLSFEEYLGYVKQHHPIIKQAGLILSTGEANLLKARGGFDPKVEVDYNRKKFKKTEYFDEFNTRFKIPVWYGIEFKANFEDNAGEFLNPNLNTPTNGLYSAGVSLSLAQGFLINERMASIKKARFFIKQTKADRDLMVNNILFDASMAYFDWIETTNELRIYNTYLDNASIRLKAIERSVNLGEKAKIDITEARITLQSRQLSFEKAKLKKRKAELVVSNYLWFNNIPMEIEDNILPIVPEFSSIQSSLIINNSIDNISDLVNTHPKLISLDAKIDRLTIDKRLKKNKLLPKIDLQYNFLSPEIDQINTFNTSNYKTSLNFSFPLFLRKERGDLKLAELKLQEVNYERLSFTLYIKNKISDVNSEMESLTVQNNLMRSIVSDYQTLVKAEERKFFLGESSLFLINSREQKLIDAQLKENKLLIKQLSITAKLYNVLGVTEFININ
ncbi:TolC family protein [uncultured Lacinutrix sp.]|uniref:TolC family protein n=1 Tax=uncultured Lacinutrix sp. TaxID=574032 RepID=UPI00262EF644|nr:TolC family protein [uncultured Lacinutrix sp.]